MRLPDLPAQPRKQHASQTADELARAQNPAAPGGPFSPGLQVPPPAPFSGGAAPSSPGNQAAMPAPARAASPTARGQGSQTARSFTALQANRFGHATGLHLKLRFLVALMILSLAPAFTLVLLYQQANREQVAHASQQMLLSTAQANVVSFQQALSLRQTQALALTKQPSILQVSQGTATAEIRQQGQLLLDEAHAATPESVAWLILDAQNQVVLASPPTLAGQRLDTLSALQHPAELAAFVQARRSTPAGPSPASSLPLITSGADTAIHGKAWLALLAFLSPTSPATSSAVLGLFAAPGLIQPALSTALAPTPTRYAALVDNHNVLLGTTPQSALTAKLGQPISDEALVGLLRTIREQQGSSTPMVITDPVTGTQEELAGVLLKPLGWISLVAAPPADLMPPTALPLLSARNTPLILLTLVVVMSLVVTWVALPIVRPIRRSTREILDCSDDVRALAEQSKKIAADQRLGTEILAAAATGLDLRRKSIGRDATLIAASVSKALDRLAWVGRELPQQVADSSIRSAFMDQLREMYYELQQGTQLATEIASTMENDPAHQKLGNVKEGAEEISLQFDQASRRLESGAKRLEEAVRVLQ